jgi:hypothetical protein
MGRRGDGIIFDPQPGEGSDGEEAAIVLVSVGAAKIDQLVALARVDRAG